MVEFTYEAVWVQDFCFGGVFNYWFNFITSNLPIQIFPFWFNLRRWCISKSLSTSRLSSVWCITFYQIKWISQSFAFMWCWCLLLLSHFWFYLFPPSLIFLVRLDKMSTILFVLSKSKPLFSLIFSIKLFFFLLSGSTTRHVGS